MCISIPEECKTSASLQPQVMETKANGEALHPEHYRKHSQHLVTAFAAQVADYSLRVHNDSADPYMCCHGPEKSSIPMLATI